METTVVDCNDFDDFVTKLFESEAGLPHSIQLDLIEEIKGNTQQECFRLLGKILTKGLLIKYGEDVALSRLTGRQIGEMKAYMASLGYQIWIDQEEITTQTAKPENSGQFFPWILKIRHPPGTGQFHQVMFCPLTIS